MLALPRLKFTSTPENLYPLEKQLKASGVELMEILYIMSVFHQNIRHTNQANWAMP